MRTLASEREIRLAGLPLSEGVVLARVYVFENRGADAIPLYRVSDEDLPDEKRRVERALEIAVDQLQGLVEEVTRRAGPAQANIFLAQKLMVQDPVLLDQLNYAIEEERLNAEAAVDKILDGYESILLEVDNEYLKERASDIGEMRRRVLENLRQATAEGNGRSRELFTFDEPRVVVAEDLSPSETVTLDKKNMVAFITERGGRASHAAILARALGIPAVSGIKGIQHMMSHGQEVLVNGTTGEIILWPSEATLHLYPNARRPMRQKLQIIKPTPGFQVYANISVSTDVDSVLEVQAEGIGLYRTEFECLSAGRLLTEEEHYLRYLHVVSAMEGKPVHIRLLDLGGDKAADFMNIPIEENPCLGYRGARLLERNPEILTTQARAIARASSHGPINIIYPMIVDVDQFLKLRAIVQQAASDFPKAQIRHGVMFEVPSLCLAAREILDVADFGSIGTNDLIQYLFAVDRNNELIADDYTPDKPIFWSVLRDLAEAAVDCEKPLCVCGEIGGQPQYIPRIFDSGIRSVSVSPRLIGLSRTAARQVMK